MTLRRDDVAGDAEVDGGGREELDEGDEEGGRRHKQLDRVAGVSGLREHEREARSCVVDAGICQFSCVTSEKYGT